ncbi:YadA C-terminal domain-containing protein, partial [Haemophilus influenzae]|uniref:YadA C-terminal domain-containing protein n=1 Tax=Haemophilus influenzae TaxID=727 RepID=UPI00200AC006
MAGKVDQNKKDTDAEIAKKANQTDVDANKADIKKFGNQTNANTALLLTMAGKVDQNKKDTDAEIAKKADKTELANKADKDSVYSKSETDNKFALKADNSVVSAQAADISNLRTDVYAHKVDIDKLRTDVNAHTKRLDNLDNRVNNLNKDLKRGLASQAALNGLFQPYNVGKLNLTAAVGGYKSQTAVAVGTGYRYNENIAAKAGVAFTHGGSATYNVGVNFEW